MARERALACGCFRVTSQALCFGKGQDNPEARSWARQVPAARIAGADFHGSATSGVDDELGKQTVQTPGLRRDNSEVSARPDGPRPVQSLKCEGFTTCLYASEYEGQA
eukprot:5352301-Pleurochrysis_carterae.AAC.1